MRLQATVYFHASLAGSWGMSIPHGQFSNFHIVTSGRCVVRGGGDEVALDAGDLVVFPTGTDHTLGANEGATTVPAAHLMPQLRGEGRYGSGEETTQLICGHFDLLTVQKHPLFRGLPDRIVLRGTGSWVQTATALAAAQCEQGEVGAGAIVDRLAEALFIEILRRYMAEQPLGPGALAGLAHPRLSRALQAMHEDYADSWTLDRLARVAGMSRTRFAETFGAIVGETPSAYLMGWRLATACGLLLEEKGLEEVAECVGYGNAFSFSKAFKRTYGVPPSGWRKQRG